MVGCILPSLSDVALLGLLSRVLGLSSASGPNECAGQYVNAGTTGQGGAGRGRAGRDGVGWGGRGDSAARW